MIDLTLTTEQQFTIAMCLKNVEYLNDVKSVTLTNGDVIELQQSVVYDIIKSIMQQMMMKDNLIKELLLEKTRVSEADIASATGSLFNIKRDSQSN